MNLNQFPDAIHAIQCNLLQANQTLRQLQIIVDQLNGRIEYEIAFDVNLKNDAQRKARRIELMSTVEYCQAVEQFQAAKDHFNQIEIDYKLLVDRFAVAKLEKRETIAALELRAGAIYN